MRDARSECWECVHKREVPWDTHISCDNPSSEVLVKGNAHGKRNGWFCYPVNFDPVWKECLCPNFEAAVSPAISQPVSPETNAQTS